MLKKFGIFLIVLVGIINVLVWFSNTNVETDSDITKIVDIPVSAKIASNKVVIKNKPVQVYNGKSLSISKKEFNCLVKNIYYEAGIEDYNGKLAVAQVTMNRLQSKKYGNNVCAVVYAKSQFSWTLNKNNSKPKGQLYTDSIKAAKDFLSGKRIKGIENANYYHAEYINTPKWANSMKVTHKIGQHLFYVGV